MRTEIFVFGAYVHKNMMVLCSYDNDKGDMWLCFATYFNIQIKTGYHTKKLFFLCVCVCVGIGQTRRDNPAPVVMGIITPQLVAKPLPLVIPYSRSETLTSGASASRALSFFSWSFVVFLGCFLRSFFPSIFKEKSIFSVINMWIWKCLLMKMEWKVTSHILRDKWVKLSFLWSFWSWIF